MRKQTRRSISISGATYDLLKAYCQKHDRSMSSIVEETLRASFPADLAPDTQVVAWDGASPAPPKSDAPASPVNEARPPPTKPEKSRPTGSGFTF